MKVRHLKVENFRGIRELDWHLAGDFICLVGPGDSCKSTVLDAVELVLSPRWNPSIDDSDFYRTDTTCPIAIEITIGQLPRRLVSDAHFGLRIRGYDAQQREIHDEPEDEDEPVLTVRFSCDESLEPAWNVVTDRHPEGHVISARDREKLGVSRLGHMLDRHLSWSRGSALSRLTGEVDEHSSLLATASREARSRVAEDQLPQMAKAASHASERAARLGVRAQENYGPRMDPSAGFDSGGLTLHDGPVPLRRFGVGTRRLVTLSMQRVGVREGGIVLIDEVEHGLEPYRLRRLLAELLAEPRDDDSSAPQGGAATILTTHSPVALSQLRCSQLRIVRSSGGITQMCEPDESLQGTIIRHAEAVLSRRVIVCEGATELGLLTGLDEVWSQSGSSFALTGVGLTDGGGAQRVAEVALEFRRLGYETALLADSDVPLSRTPEELLEGGVTVVQWEGGAATEQRLMLDLPWPAVAEAVQTAIDDGQPVLDQLSSQLKRSTSGLKAAPRDWLQSESEDDLRRGLGLAAKKGGWFKSTRKGASLGRVVANNLHSIGETALGKDLGRIREWTRADGG